MTLPRAFPVSLSANAVPVRFSNWPTMVTVLVGQFRVRAGRADHLRGAGHPQVEGDPGVRPRVVDGVDPVGPVGDQEVGAAGHLDEYVSSPPPPRSVSSPSPPSRVSFPGPADQAVGRVVVGRVRQGGAVPAGRVRRPAGRRPTRRPGCPPRPRRPARPARRRRSAGRSRPPRPARSGRCRAGSDGRRTSAPSPARTITRLPGLNCAEDDAVGHHLDRARGSAPGLTADGVRRGRPGHHQGLVGPDRPVRVGHGQRMSYVAFAWRVNTRSRVVNVTRRPPARPFTIRVTVQTKVRSASSTGPGVGPGRGQGDLGRVVRRQRRG